MHKHKRQPEHAPISDYERRVRQTLTDVLAPYHDQYQFNNTGGHFNNRVVAHLNAGRNLDSAVYLALTGGSCKTGSERGLSIPCSVRNEIANEITKRLQ